MYAIWLPVLMTNTGLNLRLYAEYPWSSQFAGNMFLRLGKDEIENFTPEWTLFNAPGFMANPEVDGTRQENFAIINFTKKTVIVGGTGYTGEIKKGVFSVLNYILPHQRNVLSMHCSANVGAQGDTAVFFGLSGTGKTTLSADPERPLIGDDEHGWSEDGIFNFEGGCYAKTIDLTEESEPQIYRAIKHGAILENIGYFPGTRTPDFSDSSITENTRVSYPIYHIDNAVEPSRAGHPENIFFLTCDAFGVLPPISRLTPGQAMYHFISGYTAKVAGTEEGVTEPQATFSACFGAPFMPLHPTKYAEMLGEKMQKHDVRVWLVNTGWTGGAHGTGSRMKLRYTRAMIHAALEGKLDKVEYKKQEFFGLPIPTSCPDVPDELLDPKNTWTDKDAFDRKARELAKKFNDNFKQFEDKANEEILAAAPQQPEQIS
jgi:phosphoenolpyruvate carboxykinase (ATP)